MSTTRMEDRDRVRVVTIDRPQVRNAADSETAAALAAVFEEFETIDHLAVAVLTGAEGIFCSGADLAEIAAGRELSTSAGEGRGPMGPTRLRLTKPVIAAIEGYAVAGGLELALWCDLRVAGSGAILGFFNRRFGVPLVDLGTVRLPRLVGQGRALDLILTGRGVGAAEALQMGLVDRFVADGEALAAALELVAEDRLPPTDRDGQRPALGAPAMGARRRPGGRIGVGPRSGHHAPRRSGVWSTCLRRRGGPPRRPSMSASALRLVAMRSRAERRPHLR